MSAHVIDDAHRFAPAAPDEEYVYGSCAPGWQSAASQETALEDWLDVLRSHGIERVVCLVPGPRLEDGPLARCRDIFGDESVLHAPVPRHHLADVETLRDEILPFLQAAVDDGAPVVVHGLAGIGRTGHVLAAWLVWGRGYAPHEAIDTVREMGRDPYEPVERETATRQDLLGSLAALA